MLTVILKRTIKNLTQKCIVKEMRRELNSSLQKYLRNNNNNKKAIMEEVGNKKI